jgi:hypothetical protein
VIGISMVLVLVGIVTLAIGFFDESRPEFIYATIGTSLLAAVFLLLGILRQRPSSQQPALALNRGDQVREPGDPESWGTAAWAARSGGVGTLEREHVDYGGAETSYDDPPARHREVAEPIEEPDESDIEDVRSADWWAPAEDEPGEYERVDSTQQLRDYDEPAWGADEPDAAWTEDEDAQPAAETWNGTAPEPVQPAWAAAETGVWDPLEAAPAEPAHGPEPVAPPASAAASPSERETERFLEALRPVRGVGPSKQSDLLAHFKTLRRLRNATVERIAEVPGISTTLAQRIYNELHH